MTKEMKTMWRFEKLYVHVACCDVEAPEELWVGAPAPAVLPSGVSFSKHFGIEWSWSKEDQPHEKFSWGTSPEEVVEEWMFEHA
jgi:hypothetical protein